MFSISRKVLRNVASSTFTKEQVSALIQRISDAKESGNFTEVTSYLRDTLSADKTTSVRIPISGTELPLPAYLARTNSVPLLRQLLDDGVVNFSAADISAEDMWEHINVTKADIPHVCAIMEKFGDQLQGPCSVDLALWIGAHPHLVRPLTDALSTIPCPYPHLARAVVEVTPINSQAVTIAAKHDMVDWLMKNTARLAAARPEGYASWAALLNHLQSQQELSDEVQLALGTLATLSEPEITRPSPAAIKAQQKASVDICLKKSAPAEMEGVCAKFEKLGDDLSQYTKKMHRGLRNCLLMPALRL
jgi:hypothetical protein